MSSRDTSTVFSPAESCATPLSSTSQNPARRKGAVSREECANCLNFLNMPEGQTFLRQWHVKLQARKGQDGIAKLSEKTKSKEYEDRKPEIFYYYMQGHSAKCIKEELERAGFEFSASSEKTLGNRLEDWGFTLNPEIRRLLKADLRKKVADLLRVNYDQLDHAESSIAHLNQPQTVTIGDPILSLNAFPYSSINRPDSPTFKPSAADSQAADLGYDATFAHGNGDLHHFNDPQASLRAIPSISGPSTFVQGPSAPDFEFQMDFNLDFNSPVHLGEANLEFRSQDIASNPVDVDSGYNSMQNQANVTSQAGIISHRPFHPKTSYFDPNSTVEREPEAEHGTSQTAADLYTDFNSPITSEDFPKSVSILHIIPCAKNHTAVSRSSSTTCECGVRQVHAMCMRIGDFDDHQILRRLKRIHDKGGVDGAGNTALHYIAETGRRQVLDYMLNFDGIDIQRLNALGQNFLHVLDGTRFGDELASFLWKFKGFGLLDQRDHHGRTVLHGLLRHPIKQSVCREIREMYGPTPSHYLALRDNEGKDAARYLWDLSKQRFPFASYAHSDYARSIVLLENDAKSFIVGYSAVDGSHPQTLQDEERGQKQVLWQRQEPNTEDCKGKNALHCLAYWPIGHTSAEEDYRVHQMTQTLVSGVDANSYDRDGRTPLITHICQSPPNEEESAIHSITALLINYRADVQMVDRNGHSALYYALQKGFSNCVAILIQHGARVNYRAAGGRSLRMIAQENLLMHLSASDEEGRTKLKHCLAIMSALNDGKAVLNPTPLEEWGIP